MNIVAAYVTTAVCTKVSTRLQVPQITGHQILTVTTELTKTCQVLNAVCEPAVCIGS